MSISHLCPQKNSESFSFVITFICVNKAKEFVFGWGQQKERKVAIMADCVWFPTFCGEVCAAAWEVCRTHGISCHVDVFVAEFYSQIERWDWLKSTFLTYVCNQEETIWSDDYMMHHFPYLSGYWIWIIFGESICYTCVSIFKLKLLSFMIFLYDISDYVNNCKIYILGKHFSVVIWH